MLSWHSHSTAPPLLFTILLLLSVFFTISKVLISCACTMVLVISLAFMVSLTLIGLATLWLVPLYPALCDSMGGGPVCWSAKKQTCIALSSTKVEYVAMTHTIQEGIWLRQSFAQMNISCPTPLVLQSDNFGAVSLSSNSSDHICTKHIDIRYHFIYSHIEQNTFIITYVAGSKNTSDIFTKPLNCVLFQKHVNLISHWGGVLRYNLSITPLSTLWCHDVSLLTSVSMHGHYYQYKYLFLSFFHPLRCSHHFVTNWEITIFRI